MSTTGRSRVSRASPRDGFWRGRVPCPGRGAALLCCSAEPGPISALCDDGPRISSASRRDCGALRSIRGTMTLCLVDTVSASGTLFRFGFLLHIGTQHGVDAALIAIAFALEIVEHVFVDTNGDRLFPRGYHQNGVRPVDIDGRRIGIVCDRPGDVLVGEGIDASPVSLALPPIAPFSRYDLLFLHCS